MRCSFPRMALTAGALLLAGAVGGCGGNHGKSAKLSGSGSSFVDPLMSKWKEVYKNEKGVTINYQPQGSGAGIQQMIEGAVDFGCTDAFMKPEQLDKARAASGDVVHIPLVMGAVVPAYNLEGLDKPVHFSGEVLSDIFLEKVKKWNDPRLVAINPGLSLPDREITTVHRSDSSGTTSVFTDYLSKVSPEWKERVGTGTTVKWAGGVAADKNPGVAGHISKTAGCIGYIELTYALQNKIQYGWVQNREKKFIEPSLESVTRAADAALADIPADLRYSITDAPGADAYPISGTVWAVVYQRQASDNGQELVDFLRWMTHDGQKYASDLHYAALPEGLTKLVEGKISSIQVGK